MIKRVIVLPDVHLTTSVPKPYQVVKKFIKDYKPDEVILLGDFMDIEALNHWNKSKRRLLENKRYQRECDAATEELDYLSKYTKNITFIEGNHENWVEQYVDRNPEMEGMIELPKMLSLDDRNIKWIPLNKLYKLGHCYFLHGNWINKHHAMKHVTSLGCNIVYGHTHHAQNAMMNMAMQKPIMAYGLGCLCNHEPEYMKGKQANWICQFAIFEYDDSNGAFNLTPINVINNKFIYNGKVYK